MIFRPKYYAKHRYLSLSEIIFLFNALTPLAGDLSKAIYNEKHKINIAYEYFLETILIFMQSSIQSKSELVLIFSTC